jgi:hypothetical protein
VKVLTPFGLFLSKSSKTRWLTQDTSPKSIPEAYRENERVWGLLRRAISEKPNVLIVGAGKESDFSSISAKTSDWLRVGIQYTNFNHELNVDVIGGNHIALLEASALSDGASSRLILHGVGSLVPSVLLNSCTVRWADPFIHVKWPGGSPTVQLAAEFISKNTCGPVPLVLASQNSLFMLAMVAIHLGAKTIAFTGVDPLNPVYFFENDFTLISHIISALASTDPWLGEWDGVNERIPLLHRSTAHRTLSMFPFIISGRSAVGDPERLLTMRRGLEFFLSLANYSSIDVGYFGTSSFMDELGIEKYG